MDKNIAVQEEEGVLALPGFRFHPTEEELLNFYLRRTAMGINTCSNVISFLNIYHHHPSELPGLAKITGEREWYFFVHRDRKHGHGGRPARTTEHGFWKATGSDRQIRSLTEPKKIMGLKKTLVFYKGRAPKGIKTDWIMNEYRLPDHCNNLIPPPKEDIVLCKIYRKATSLKILEQRAAAMEDHHQLKTMINGADHPLSSWSSSAPSDEDTSTIDDPTNGYDHLESWFNNNITTPSFITSTFNQDNKIDYFVEDCDHSAAAVNILPPPPPPPPPYADCIAAVEQAYTCGDSFNTPFVWMEQWSPYSDI